LVEDLDGALDAEAMGAQRGEQLAVTDLIALDVVGTAG
jgi:hypothetical protein